MDYKAIHYDAFITYHRLSDEARAMALERALKRFAKPLFKLRALEIFRDDAALAANPSHWSSISEALDSAGHLILVASPGAASSPWVGREVAHWLARKSSDGLMIVLSDGDIRWDRSAGDFDWATTTALPETMRTRFGDEPRWIDFRWAREDADLTLDNPRFVATVAELAAPMHGKPKDTLIGEDVSQHRRLNRLTRLATGSLLLLVVGLSVSLVYALLQRDEAQRQTRLALAAAREAKGRQLALEAEAIQRDLTGSIASERAAALAIEGWRRQPSHVAYEAAAIALTELPVWRHPGESGGGSIAFLPDGEHAVHGADHDLSVWNVARNHELFRKTLDLSVTEVAISPDGALLAVAGFENHVLVFGAANGAER